MTSGRRRRVQRCRAGGAGHFRRPLLHAICSGTLVTNANYVEEVAREIRREVPPDVLPDEDSEELFLMYATLVLSKGASVTARDVHDAWSAWMTAKDPDHESIKPYDE